MERLTILNRKIFDEEEIKWYSINNNPNDNTINLHTAIEKLGTIEDLEEELGIDLLTLFKANKVYFKFFEESDEILESVEVHFDITNKILRAYSYPEDEFGTTLELSSYGKLWSLRKEDLQDEKED